MYNLLVIDPPWPKKKGGIRSARPNQGRSLDYQTLSIIEIFALLDAKIFPLTLTPHTVFMWATEEFLTDCEHQMTSRSYKRHARLIWNKTNGVAPAFSVRFSHEYLLWFYKPKFTPVHPSCRGKFTTVFTEKPREHSRKPDIAYNMIKEMFPDATRLDVFSREDRPGWDVWGDECGKFNQPE